MFMCMCVNACVYVYMYHSRHVEIRGQLVGAGSLFIACGSSHKARGQAPLRTEPYPRSFLLLFGM